MFPIQNSENVPPYVELSSAAIFTMNEAGLGGSYEPLIIIDEARVPALSHMPEGKYGVVVGSGPNTPEWAERGWCTLDIDPSCRPQVVADANFMAQAFPEHTWGRWDYVLAENIRIDPTGGLGVNPTKLLEEASILLKEGGILTVVSVNGYNKSPGATVPDKDIFAGKMCKLGFTTVVESHLVHKYIRSDGLGEGVQQRVIYYGRKNPPPSTPVATIAN